jgi:hypothetical protein
MAGYHQLVRNAMELPTITASELAYRAVEFANHLAEKLRDVNQKYPTAVLGPEFNDIMAQARMGTLPGPTPAESIPIFEQLFYAYMASRYVIIPDKR